MSIEVISEQGYIPPVTCPNCGESQNRFSSRFGPEHSGYDRIDCMVCGRVFEAEEYQDLVSEARSKMIPPPAFRE